MEQHQKQTKDEKIKELTEKLEEGIKSVFASSKYREYLTVMSKFHSYSFNNSILILMQKPDARYVAGYRTWESLNRHVKKGEKGITILAPNPHRLTKEVTVINPETGQPRLDADGKPMTEQKQITYASFRPITIFDVSQTEGEPLPELVTELKKKALNYPLLMNIIKSTSPVPIRFESWEGLAKGYYNRTSDEIVIKDGMSESQTLKTALHETAHSILHADKKNLKDPATKEIKAESVAFIVCNHFGIDTSDYSFAYLASWSSSKELPELRASLKTIQTTAHDLIDRMDEQIQRHMEIQRQPEIIGTDIQNTQEIHHSRR